VNNIFVSIDLDKKCAECGKDGACQSGICLKCTSKMMFGKKPMKSAYGRGLQRQFHERFKREKL
jgi:hypothetical protein